MKTLITEDKARFEQKYQSPEVLPSFHNFVVLSNNEKAVQVPNEERRFFMLAAKRKLYTKSEWADLWALVKDPTFQALFFQYLLNADASIIHKGQAPMTSFKTKIQAKQAPETIKFLKALLDDPALMQRPMADLHSETEQLALRNEFETRGRFLLKSRPNLTETRVFSNLAEEKDWQEFQLKNDLQRNSAMKEVVPYRHVVQCVISHFKGEAYAKVTSEDVFSVMESLGITKANIKVPAGSSSKRSFVFPSVQGLEYLLKRQNWMTAEDLITDEDTHTT